MSLICTLSTDVRSYGQSFMFAEMKDVKLLCSTFSCVILVPVMKAPQLRTRRAWALRSPCHQDGPKLPRIPWGRWLYIVFIGEIQKNENVLHFFRVAADAQMCWWVFAWPDWEQYNISFQIGSRRHPSAYLGVHSDPEKMQNIFIFCISPMNTSVREESKPF